MLGKVVTQLVKVSHLQMPTLYDLFEKLLGKNGDFWWDRLKKFLRQEPCFAKEKPVFFDLLETVEIPIDTTMDLPAFFSGGNRLLSFSGSGCGKILELASGKPHESIALEVRQMRERAHRIEFASDLPSNFCIDPTDFFFALASEIMRASQGGESKMIGSYQWRSFYIYRYKISVRWRESEKQCAIGLEKDGGQQEIGNIILTAAHKG